MKPRELANLGVPRGEAMKVAAEACGAAARAGLDKAAIRQALAALVADPEAYSADPHFAALAAAISRHNSRPATLRPAGGTGSMAPVGNGPGRLGRRPTP